MNCQSHFYRGLDPRLVTRRWFFQQCGVGLALFALGTLFRESGWASPAVLANPLAPKQPHFPARANASSFSSWLARRAIWNCSTTNRANEVEWQGAAGRVGQGLPRGVHQPKRRFAWPEIQIRENTGQSGAELSELLPRLAEVVTTSPSSSPCTPTRSITRRDKILMSTGSQQFGRPSLGAWTTYGLGQRVTGFALVCRFQHRPERA